MAAFLLLPSSAVAGTSFRPIFCESKNLTHTSSQLFLSSSLFSMSHTALPLKFSKIALRVRHRSSTVSSRPTVAKVFLNALILVIVWSLFARYLPSSNNTFTIFLLISSSCSSLLSFRSLCLSAKSMSLAHMPGRAFRNIFLISFFFCSLKFVLHRFRSPFHFFSVHPSGRSTTLLCSSRMALIQSSPPHSSNINSATFCSRSVSVLTVESVVVFGRISSEKRFNNDSTWAGLMLHGNFSSVFVLNIPRIVSSSSFAMVSSFVPSLIFPALRKALL